MLLLQAAFREFHRSGFQSTGLDTILAATGISKGALYHHFENKEAPGYAIVEEIIAKLICEKWLRPLELCEDPHRYRDWHRSGYLSPARRRA